MKNLIFVMALASILSLPAAIAHADESEIIYKLNKVEQKQDDILSALADIKAELEIVKVRATTKS